jgi:phospholipase A2
MNRFHIYSYLILVVVGSVWADAITIYNKTLRDVYVAIYYQEVSYYVGTPANGQRVTHITCLESNSSIILERPERVWGFDRELVFSEYAESLAEHLTAADFKKYHSKNIGTMQGSTFYIGDDEGELYAYTSVEWHAIQVPLEYAQNQLLDMIPAIKNNPYKNTTARIRKGNELCGQERSHRFLRLQKVKESFEELYQQPLSGNAPTISVVCSGGGYRAMLYTLGALRALEQTKFLNTVSYLVGLSGSTWAIGSWLSSGKSIDEYHEWVINNITFDMTSIDSEDVSLIGEVLLNKYCSGQPLGIVDIYGACVANDLFDCFSNDKDRVYLSEQSKRIEDGSLPFPIYTAISGETSNSEHLWYEFSPYEVGAPWLGYYVPTWSFGRKFKNGFSVSNAPEQPLGTLLGTFGLAVGITIKRLLKETNIADKVKMPLTKKLINAIVDQYGDDRPISAEYFNMTYGINNAPFNNLKIAHLVDAGINFNLPYPPISGLRSERASDIIIFVDSSAGKVGQELQKAEHYARYHKLPFPKIDYTDIDKRAVTIFVETDSLVPVVIYVPRIVDHEQLAQVKNNSCYQELYGYLHNFDIEKCIADEACNTFNFCYTKDQARSLTALGEFNMKIACEGLKNILMPI